MTMLLQEDMAMNALHVRAAASRSLPGARQSTVRERAVQGCLAVLALLAVLLGTSQVAADERQLSKRHQLDPAAKVEMNSPDKAMLNRRTGPKGGIKVISDFRAEDLIPDICKGCSS
jgi:hypothetical protein